MNPSEINLHNAQIAPGFIRLRLVFDMALHICRESHITVRKEKSINIRIYDSHCTKSHDPQIRSRQKHVLLWFRHLDIHSHEHNKEHETPGFMIHS
jgi:hypothetical protein